MNPKWVGFLAFIWLVGVILGATYDKMDSAEWDARVSETKMEYLLNYKNVTYEQGVFGTVTFPLPNPTYFETVLNIATFNFEFLQGEGYQFIRWFLQIFALMGVLAFIWSAVDLLQGFIPFT